MEQATSYSGEVASGIPKTEFVIKMPLKVSEHIDRGISSLKAAPRVGLLAEGFTPFTHLLVQVGSKEIYVWTHTRGDVALLCFFNNACIKRS